ncbi:hypothetical protein SS37A_37000 (plasmid) [Methylocystis iwaonis]|uniref:Uncharacterized protein n=2 Tax=Methylocystis iwaonis TaxID=2885079 RepID=A0ABN6VP75_9HYPH|nr:hypothetical protein SS37A_37000 [Methylocystis iwaonis]
MTVLEEDGRIIQLSLLQELAYGELDGSLTPRIHALDGFLRSAQIGARLSSCVRREMWEKWILLSALGAVTCLMRGLIGEVEESWPRSLGQLPADFKWISAGVC